MRKEGLIGYLLAISVLISLLGSALGVGHAAGPSPVAGEEHVYEVTVGPPKAFKMGDYDLVRLPWCGFLMAMGKPLLPTQVYFVLEPPEGIERITVEPLKWKELPGKYDIPPMLPPTTNMTGWTPKPIPDPEVYGSREPYPGVLYRLSERPHVWRGLRYRVLTLYPLQYVPADKKLVFYETFRIRIKYGPPSPEKFIFKPVEPIFTSVVLPRVVNRDILPHWNIELDVDVMYLIITREMFLDELQPFVELKENLHGEPVLVITVDWIVDHWPGRDVPEKIRNYIRHVYEEHGIWYVLLFGDADPTDLWTNYELDHDWEVPTRYVYNPDRVCVDWDEHTGECRKWVDPDKDALDDIFGDQAQDEMGDYTPTDLYYACLDGDWDDDGDRIFGEDKAYSDVGVEEVDWAPEVAVGRIPVRTDSEAAEIVQKLCDYFGTTGYKPRARRKYFLLIGAEMDDYTDAKDVKEYVRRYSEISTVEIYETGGGDMSLTRANVEDAIKEYDPILINCFSHGWIDYLVYDATTLSPKKYITYPESFYELENVTGFFITAYACLAGAFDTYEYVPYSTACLGEYLLRWSKGAAVAFIGFNRMAYYASCQNLGKKCTYIINSLLGFHDRQFWYHFFTLYNPGAQPYMFLVPGLLQEVTYSCAVCEYINNCDLDAIERECYRKNYFSVTLLGDPSLRIFGTPSIIDKVVEGLVERLKNITVTGHDFLPHARIGIYLRYTDPYTYEFTFVKIGDTTADGEGRVGATVAIPEDAPLGQADVILIDEYGNFAVAGHITVVSGEEHPPPPPPQGGAGGQDSDGDLWPDTLDPWPDNPWLPNLAIATIGVSIVVITVLLLLRKKS